MLVFPRADDEPLSNWWGLVSRPGAPHLHCVNITTVQWVGLSGSVYIDYAPDTGEVRLINPKLARFDVKQVWQVSPGLLGYKACGILLSGILAGVLVTQAPSCLIAGPTTEEYPSFARGFV